MRESPTSNTSEEEESSSEKSKPVPTLGAPIVDAPPEDLEQSPRQKRPLKLHRRLGPPAPPPADAPVQQEPLPVNEDADDDPGETDETLAAESEPGETREEKEHNPARPRLRLRRQDPAPEDKSAASGAEGALFQDFDPASIQPMDLNETDEEDDESTALVDEMSAAGKPDADSDSVPAQESSMAEHAVKDEGRKPPPPPNAPVVGKPVVRPGPPPVPPQARSAQGAPPKAPSAAAGTGKRATRGEKAALIVGAIVVLVIVAAALGVIGYAFNMVAGADAETTDPQPAIQRDARAEETATPASTPASASSEFLATVPPVETVIPGDPAIRRFVDGLNISMVRGGYDPRIFVGSVAYSAGAVIDPRMELVFLGVNEAEGEVVFQDSQGARYYRKY